MEIKVVEKTKKRLIIELKGATNTICNVLKEELWEDKAIVAAAYNIDHPLIGVPKFIIETDGKDPVKTFTDAIDRLKKKNKELVDKFSKLKV